MKTKVLVFEDNDAYRESLSLLINMTPDMECLGAFPDCRHVVDRVTENLPDVVLMDIDMPNVNGIQGLMLLRKQYPELKILMQTVFEDDEKVFACICAGADGYILKKASPIDLLNGIKDVLRGGAPMTPTIARQVLRLFSHQNKPKNGPEFNLSDRETEILSFLVKGLSYKMIAEKCFIAQSTVNAHVRNIYDKLQVHSKGSAIALAIEKKIF
jgi:DNA-binding NarL/FixJ family response regulator